MRVIDKIDVDIIVTLARAAAAEMGCWVLIIFSAQQKLWWLAGVFLIVAVILNIVGRCCQKLLDV